MSFCAFSSNIRREWFECQYIVHLHLLNRFSHLSGDVVGSLCGRSRVTFLGALFNGFLEIARVLFNGSPLAAAHGFSLKYISTKWLRHVCVDLFTFLRGFTESLVNTEEESRFKHEIVRLVRPPYDGLTSVIHHIARHSQAGENTISWHDCELRLRFFGPSTRDEKSRYIGLCRFHLNTLVLFCLSRVSRLHWSTELNLLSGPFTVFLIRTSSFP